jgi:hypothetical protein
VPYHGSRNLEHILPRGLDVDAVLNFFIKDQWIFKALFVIYLVMFIIKLVRILVINKKPGAFLMFHFCFLINSITALFVDEFIGAALIVYFGYFVLKYPKATMLEKTPLLGDIAKITNEIRQIYLMNWNSVKKYCEENQFRRFFGLHRDIEVQTWRKEIKKSMNHHADKIFKGAIKTNLIVGLVQYAMNPGVFWQLGIMSRPRKISIPLFIAGIPFQMILSVALACFAALFLLFLRPLIDMYFEIQCKDPEYVSLL